MSFGTPFYLKISEVHLVHELLYLISISEEQKIVKGSEKKFAIRILDHLKV